MQTLVRNKKIIKALENYSLFCISYPWTGMLTAIIIMNTITQIMFAVLSSLPCCKRKKCNILFFREISHLDVPKADTTHVQYAAWGAQDNQLVSPESASL